MAVIAILAVASAFPLSFAIWSAITFARNYAKAKATGLSISPRYVSPGSPLWMLFAPLVIRILSYLPFTGGFIKVYRRGWEARERCRPHVELGGLFFVVTPGQNWLKVGDAQVAADILHRKDEFMRNLVSFEVLDIYGKSLASSAGADWNRHRKVAAVTFTEKNNELVWRESLKEASQMLEYWVRRARQPIRSLNEDVRIFTMNVLAAALFDKSYPFESREESKRRGETGGKDKAFAYRDSLSTILRMILAILVFGEKTLRSAWWLPKSFRDAGEAVADFRTYITELINEERVLISQGKTNSPNLVTNLVRACEDDQDDLKTVGSIPRRAILSKDEIISNLFVFAFAGNDTTALTLNYILGEMAAHPEIQDWIWEEIQLHCPDSAASEWDYQTCSKLKRCWAVIYETLRISHPLGQLVKTTGPLPRKVRYEGRDVMIPAETIVEINLPGIQTHPRYWGPDSLEWNPRRFISNAAAGIDKEILSADTSDVFFPWAYGRNVCPGKRFSQVELVAVMATLFRQYKLEPVPEGPESMEEARKRVGRISEDIEMRLLNEIREPEKLGVRWVKRTGSVT